MTSVQSFLRQRVVGNTTLAVDGTTQLYTLIAGSGVLNPIAYPYGALSAGNYVGNYPPGYLVAGPLVSDLATAVQGQVLNPMLRDMGKTIKAPLADSQTATAFGTFGFWRAVQVLSPSIIGSPLAISNYGVTGQAAGNRPITNGSNAGDSGYNTFYIPIVVGGEVASNVAQTAALTVSSAGYKISEQL